LAAKAEKTSQTTPMSGGVDIPGDAPSMEAITVLTPVVSSIAPNSKQASFGAGVIIDENATLKPYSLR
jgi:hypothetical protein